MYKNEKIFNFLFTNAGFSGMMKDKLVEAQRETVPAGGGIPGGRRKGTLPKRLPRHGGQLGLVGIPQVLLCEHTEELLIAASIISGNEGFASQ